MTTKELLQLIEKIFTEKLSRKTGWGKNEILVAYKDSVKEALLDTFDLSGDKPCKNDLRTAG